jgi:hypothetical protein
LFDLNIAPPNGSDIANNKSDYNNIYRGGQPLKLAAGALQSTLSAWRTATGNDVHSISADPAFIGSGSATNYAVRDGSPVIDKGMNVGSPVVADYSAGARPVGAAYDIGAFEKGSVSSGGSTGGTTPPPPTTTTPPPTTSPTPPTTSPTPTTGTVTTTSPASSTLPVVTMKAPASGSKTGSVTVTATATDSSGITQMSVYFDGTKMGSSTSSQVSATFPLSSYRVGSHELRVSAQDASGNVGAAVMTFQVTDGTTAPPTTTTPPPATSPTVDDSTPPVVSISSPGSGSSVTGTVTIRATAADNVGVTQMSIMIDGAVKATSATGSVSYTWNTAGLRAGTHSIRVSAGDASNNTGANNMSVVVR